MGAPASKYYDVLAPHYDGATEAEGSWTPPSIITKFSARYISPKIRVLDFGVGTGRCIEALKLLEEDLDITGVDTSEKMIEICQSKNYDVKLYHGTIREFYQTKPEKFDLILASGVLEFVEDLNSFFEISTNLLTKNGRIVFTYEPIIDTHELQKMPKSLVVEDPTNSLYVQDFYTYRRTPAEIEDHLSINSLLIERKEQFIAYKKLEIDVIYNLVSCKLGV